MSMVLSGTRVERLRPADAPALRAFLETRTDATVFYSLEWQDVIRTAYGHHCDYWVAWSGSDVVGAFPVLHVRVPVIGAKMVALAYQMDSGLPLADDATAHALVERASAEARRAGVRYLEIRSLREAPELEALGFHSSESGLVTTVVPLADITLARIRRNHRRSLRSAEEQGIRITESRSLVDLRAFHHMYLREGRAVGAPQAGRRFFDALHQHAPASYRLYQAWLNGRRVGGMVTVGDGRVVYARHAAYSSAEALHAHAGTALYWRAISDAAQDGCSHYNCGISWVKDEGLIHWKEGWTGFSVPVHLYVLAVKGSPPVPGDYLGGFRLAKRVWRRLPLPVAELGGQLVTSWVC